jgi:hypothetical protein
MNEEILITAAVQSYLDGHHDTIESSALAYDVSVQKMIEILGDNSGD